MGMNEVKLQGGMTKDPDFGYGAATGTPYWRTTLAVNEARYDARERRQTVYTTFASVVAFGWKAEQMMNEGLSKGDEIYLRGALDQSSWENKETGKNEHSTKVRIDSYDVVRRAGGRQSAPQSGAASPPPRTDPDDPWALPPRGQDTEPPF